MFNTFLSLETISPLSLQIAPAAVWVGLIIFIAWVVYRFTDSEAEIIRKIVHIGMGNVILIAWWLDIPAYVGITASVFASLITLLSYKFPILPGINSVGRQSLGTFFYAVSIGVLMGIFWYLHQPQYAVLGIMIMAWGDGLAALIGKRFGKHKYIVFGSQKSWEGSLTVTLSSYFICVTLLFIVQGNIWQTWIISLIVALIATILEAFSFLGIDNLTVPIGSATCAYLLTQILSSY
ncbi:SEC59/DGK1/VTE5 family protein [Aphanizomenon flos-aquae NRERC-008]|uniref:Phosphatidate cytidylyltransferase n=3 Tax=Aphanizomenon flos-aquae TaxID=1176 RepID=A0A1B7X0M8_APHFL|nr:MULTISPECIES: diacylglycerol/polyprenol kinase family protein [Aphanizomenon]MBD1217509.1 phosphatidate cytidylyltransferase [Aphanizomenon flos-aquae Clear-A1]MBO1043115.1 phosphatidate cytidylyltransferase [Aphanizomenon flos-aquae UKL13-PB]MCE2906289.1 SEC59/DGK1/VTE5 family protein [Anabaena sp. CoA2_C59]MDJ0504641.1 SEC59/DGK1/VTE5 family protein [Nostocales cyanobacterium LE14-WE12]OBQ20188.1 MAG: phosphatidate cytidylyltransferase [Anabaena sp. WA113]OBQ27136.1 MAG: phosphatidate cy